MRDRKEKVAPLRLGGEMQLIDSNPSSPALEARKLFLRLIRDTKLQVVWDLTRLFRAESIPESWKSDEKRLESAVKIFLLHTKNKDSFDMDLMACGFKPNVRSTPTLALFDYIFRNQNAYNKAYRKNSKKLGNPNSFGHSEVAAALALRDLIPDWQTLKAKKDSEWFCTELSEWGRRWNLSDDWCMNFALDCIRNFKTEFSDKLRLPDNYLTENSGFMDRWEYERFIKFGKPWVSALFHFGNERYEDYFFTSEITNYPSFNFTWKESGDREGTEAFSIQGWYNPLVMYADEFTAKMEEQFLRHFFQHYQYKWTGFIGNIPFWINRLQIFKERIEFHISACHRALEPYAKKTQVKRSGDLHIQWLLQSTIPPIKSYSRIADENSVKVSSVSDAVSEVSTLIGLTLPKRMSGGRPKGSKDKSNVKRRVTRKKLLG